MIIDGLEQDNRDLKEENARLKWRQEASEGYYIQELNDAKREIQKLKERMEETERAAKARIESLEKDGRRNQRVVDRLKAVRGSKKTVIAFSSFQQIDVDDLFAQCRNERVKQP